MFAILASFPYDSATTLKDVKYSMTPVVLKYCHVPELPGGLVKTQITRPTAEFLVCHIWGGAWQLAFLANSQVRRMLLTISPQQCFSNLSVSKNLPGDCVKTKIRRF